MAGEIFEITVVPVAQLDQVIIHAMCRVFPTSDRAGHTGVRFELS